MDVTEFREPAAGVDRTLAWGADDELGVLRFLRPATTIRAIAEVRSGETVSWVNRAGGAVGGWDQVSLDISHRAAGDGPKARSTESHRPGTSSPCREWVSGSSTTRTSIGWPKHAWATHASPSGLSCHHCT